MSVELRSSIWNALDKFLWSTKDFMYTSYGEAQIYPLSFDLWFNFFKRPADTRPRLANEILAEIRSFFFECEWYQVYDFIEWLLRYLGNRGPRYEQVLNVILERESSGYRVFRGKVTEITNEQELKMLATAIDDDKFAGAAEHLKRALELMTDRNRPDFRNSIKESISAVESVARAITNLPSGKLSDCLKAIERESQMHSALKEGLLKIYGYTSDEDGIRHAMQEMPGISRADAKFMLMVCTSFVGYLKEKASRQNE